MSYQQLMEKVMISQIPAASVSLVASLVTAAFITFGKDPSSDTNENGRSMQEIQTKTRFYSPYRRIIFGLSISDICQSFAIITGPFMVQSDVPQALWGRGNAHTCGMNGFLFLVGMTAVPMYTFSLCIYYVCKIKGKMTDAEFSIKIERRMHIFIILFNMCLYLTALGIGAINPAITGSLCTVAAYPTGCRQNPDLFGECDPFLAKAVFVFAVIASFIVPILSLFGIMGCLAVLFWHVLMMDRIFGRPRGGGDISRASIPLSSNRALGRRRLLRNISLSQEETSATNNGEISFPLPMKAVESSLEQSSAEEASVGQENQESRISGKSLHLSVSNLESQSDLDVHENVSTSAEVESSMASIPQSQDYQEDLHHQQELDIVSPHDRDPETISRLYKRELVTQACCYVAVFCFTTFMFSTSNIILLLGIQPSEAMVISTAVLFPLGGFFNILVYTRPNVASFLRKCPKCSRLQGLWLVLKAGGEVPHESKWNEISTSQRRMCFYRLFARLRKSNEQEESVSSIPAPVSYANISRQDSISELQCRIRSKPLVDSSLPDSALGINGLSLSFDSNEVAHRDCEDWIHLEGGGSRMMAIPEGDSALESSEILVSHEYADNVSSILSSRSNGGERQNKNDLDDMWAATFERVKKWTPSM